MATPPPNRQPNPSWGQSPQQPGWGQPQQPQPGWGQPQPPVKPKRGKAGCLGCAGILAVVFIIAIAASATKSSSTKTSAVAPAPTRAAAAPSTTPSAQAQPAAPSSAPAEAPSSTFSFSLPPTHLAPADTRKKAAKILTDNDAYYQTEFNQGVVVIDARGETGSFDAFHTWQQKAAVDVQPGMDAFKQADSLFDASDEPQSISNWRDDNGTLAADVAKLANDGLGAGGPDDAQARQNVKADIAQMKTDMATAEQDAADVAAGK